MKDKIRVKTVWKCDRCGYEFDYYPDKKDFLYLTYRKSWWRGHMYYSGLIKHTDKVCLCTPCFVKFQEMAESFGFMLGEKHGGPIDKKVSE